MTKAEVKTDLTRLSIIVSMLACPRCSELPSVWLSKRFFMMAMVCSTNCVLVSFIGTYKDERTIEKTLHSDPAQF